MEGKPSAQLPAHPRPGISTWGRGRPAQAALGISPAAGRPGAPRTPGHRGCLTPSRSLLPPAAPRERGRRGGRTGGRDLLRAPPPPPQTGPALGGPRGAAGRPCCGLPLPPPSPPGLEGREAWGWISSPPRRLPPGPPRLGPAARPPARPGADPAPPAPAPPSRPGSGGPRAASPGGGQPRRQAPANKGPRPARRPRGAAPAAPRSGRRGGAAPRPGSPRRSRAHAPRRSPPSPPPPPPQPPAALGPAPAARRGSPDFSPSLPSPLREAPY